MESYTDEWWINQNEKIDSIKSYNLWSRKHYVQFSCIKIDGNYCFNSWIKAETSIFNGNKDKQTLCNKCTELLINVKFNPDKLPILYYYRFRDLSNMIDVLNQICY